MTYKVIRFYKDHYRDSKVVMTGLSLEQAQEHCRRPDTRGDDWFDGYEQEESMEDKCFMCETAQGDYDNGYCQSCYEVVIEQDWDEVNS